jgi:membrane-associated phospholipid phosphatase
MAQHSNAPTGVMVEAHDGRDRIALFLSKYFSPVFAFVVGQILAVLNSPDLKSAVQWTVIGVLIQLGPVMIWYQVRMRQGRLSDADMSNRTERNEAYLLGGVSMTIALGVLAYAGAPLAVVALAASFLLIAVLSGITNIWWKISMHASAIAAVATLATMQSRSLGAAFWVLVVLVNWSRLHTRNHTLGQVTAGTVLAAAVVYVVHRFLGV